MGSDEGGELTGRWALRRIGGLLPPLGLMHKRIVGGSGATFLGPLPGLPFDVRQEDRGPVLVYRGPLGVLRDRLARREDGAWDGETLLLGVRIGRFLMTRRGRSVPGPRDRPA